ncbi:hypothetical protein [Aureivirga marina]|uniref:hypothetical protein n=1 Tax=Aureivirga marina TaxID=1182451 RepID=UPI0018C8E507|nr:hypothetical protein [Aureivirga marina]
MNTLRKYYLKTYCNKNSKILRIKSDNNKYYILGHFLDYWNDVKEVQEEIIPLLKSIIEENSMEEELESDILGFILFKKEKTIFYGNTVGDLDLEISTNDFNKIIFSWIQLLDESRNHTL